jgi:hypothetical protein
VLGFDFTITASTCYMPQGDVSNNLLKEIQMRLNTYSILIDHLEEEDNFTVFASELSVPVI